MPEYKGAPLDGGRGPGLGCFWIQIVLLVVLLVLTPLSVVWAWPSLVSAALLIVTLVLLLFAGQTIIFLLRLVAADRRSRRGPLREGASATVGQLEDAFSTDSTVPGMTASPPTETPATAPIREVPVREVTTAQAAFFFGLAIAEGVAAAFVDHSFGVWVALGVGLVFVTLAVLYRRRVLPTATSLAEFVWGVLALATYFVSVWLLFGR